LFELFIAVRGPASRFTAGAARFLILSQCSNRASPLRHDILRCCLLATRLVAVKKPNGHSAVDCGCLSAGPPFANVFSATTGDRTRATHARNHANTLVRRHILAAKPRALCRQEPAPLELRRQEPAPRRLAVLYKLGLHRPAVQRRPVGVPALRTHRQVPPNQRPVLHSRSLESDKPGPMRWPPKIPKRRRRERELYSSLISLVVVVLYGCRARHIQRRLSKLVRNVRCDLG